MIDRRQLLAGGAASISMPILAKPLAAASEPETLPFDQVIVDARIEGREALSGFAKDSNIPVVSIRGDLAKHWFDSLRSTLQFRSTVIAGITSDYDSEVMRMFARDVGYQQTHRSTNTIDAMQVTAWVIAPIN